MKRKITDHELNGLNEAIEIFVLDEPGPGGANHRYDITGIDTATNPSATKPDGYKSSFSRSILLFQNGPIQEAGYNGISNEALLAILIDRMRGFQYEREMRTRAEGDPPLPEYDESKRGKFACRENAIALTKMEEALLWLQKRTRDRLNRGVEGTHEK